MPPPGPLSVTLGAEPAGAEREEDACSGGEITLSLLTPPGPPAGSLTGWGLQEAAGTDAPKDVPQPWLEGVGVARSLPTGVLHRGLPNPSPPPRLRPPAPWPLIHGPSPRAASCGCRCHFPPTSMPTCSVVAPPCGQISLGPALWAAAGSRLRRRWPHPGGRHYGPLLPHVRAVFL